MLFVFAGPRSLPEWVFEFCSALEIDVVLSSSVHSMVQLLGNRQPLGVICFDLSHRRTKKILRVIAGYDRETPILLVNRDDPDTLGEMDTVVDISRPTSIMRAVLPLPPTTLLRFLSTAGRRTGQIRLLAS